MARISQGHLASPTSIERALRDALTEMNIEFVAEKPICGYVVDAYLPASNTVVEAQGDYFHCNPAVFANPINDMQRENVVRDRRRWAALRKKGYCVIELWEKDINEKGAAVLLAEHGIEQAA